MSAWVGLVERTRRRSVVVILRWSRRPRQGANFLLHPGYAAAVIRSEALGVLFRDDRVAVVDKPSGIATHRGWADDDDALLQWTRDTVGCFVFPVHRLDRGASGCVLFALDREAAGFLGRAFADGTAIEKRYLAITRGHPPDHIVLDHPVPRAPGEARVPATTELWRRDVLLPFIKPDEIPAFLLREIYIIQGLIWYTLRTCDSIYRIYMAIYFTSLITQYYI